MLVDQAPLHRAAHGVWLQDLARPALPCRKYACRDALLHKRKQVEPGAVAGAGGTG